MRFSLVLSALLCAGVATGCGDDDPIVFPTDTANADSGSDAGMSSDAAMDDAGMDDAGMDDAGMDDAGMDDAGADDAGGEDATEEDTGPTTGATLTTIYEDIFAVSCSGVGCHTDGANAANINLDLNDGLRDRLLGPSSVAGVPHITPGDPSMSYLYLKITGEHFDVGGGGSRMPLARPPVSDALTAELAAWITAGAPE